MNTIFFNVKIEGEDITDLIERIQVEETDDQADMASLAFTDSYMILSDVLQEGLSVEIDLGHQDLHAVIFRGMITNIQATFLTRGTPTVEIKATDNLIKLGFRPQTKKWWNLTVSQIVRELARSNDLTPDDIEPIEDAYISELRPYQQVEETDLAFLLRLAKDYDSKLYVEHLATDTLNLVSTRKLIEAPLIEEDLIFNSNLEEFTVSFDSFATATTQRLVTTDPVTGERIEINEILVEPKETLWDPSPEQVARLGQGTERIEKIWQKAKLKQQALGSYWQIPPRSSGAASRSVNYRSGTYGDWSRKLGQTAHGRAAGSIFLRPRRRVNVDGCGSRWSGDWYLSSVNHEVDVKQRSYFCSFSCTR